MLKIYDKNHEAVGNITEYDEYKIEHDVSTGDKTLYFDYYGTLKIDTEYYVQNDTDEYVIKEKSVTSGDKIEYVAALNLEELEAVPWESFQVTDSTIDDAARLALTGTGWTVGTGTVTKKRNAGMVQQSTLGVIQKLCTAFMCECTYDTKNKVVTFYEQVGEDKGVYFTKQLNLLKLTKKDSSYDYYTRIIPIGADDLTIESVNDGVKYLENYQYSNKIRSYIWEDSNYTDPQALKDDAEKKLADMSKPITSYSVDVVDLAAQTSDYDLLAFHAGDTVQLFDEETGVKDCQRIMKLTEYPDNPEKNSCELANTVLTWEELHQKEQEAADIVGTVISSDGKIKVSDILHFDSGVSSSQSFIDLSGDVDSVKAKIGTIETNYLTAEQAKVLYATIESLEATDASITNLNAEYASFKSTVTDEFAADEAQIKVLDADKANIDFANVAVAKIETGFLKNLMVSQGLLADKVISPEVTVTDCLTGVHIYADDITAGTLSVDRLEIRGSEKSLVYELNNIDGALQSKSVDTLNGEVITDRSITTDKVVANAITANEIAAGAVVTEKIAANTITGDKIAANTIKAEQIDVDNLFSQDITATGTIEGATLKGTNIEAVSGDVGGWTIKNNELSTTNYLKNGVASTVKLQNKYKDTNAINYFSTTLTNCELIKRDGFTVTVKSTSDGKGIVAFSIEFKKNSYSNFYIVSVDTSYRTAARYDDGLYVNSDVAYYDANGDWIGSFVEEELTTDIFGSIPDSSGATVNTLKCPVGPNGWSPDAFTYFSVYVRYIMPTMTAGTEYTIKCDVSTTTDGSISVLADESILSIERTAQSVDNGKLTSTKQKVLNITANGEVDCQEIEIATKAKLGDIALIVDSAGRMAHQESDGTTKTYAYTEEVEAVAADVETLDGNVSTLTSDLSTTNQNVSNISAKLGTTDISAIGDGTVTGAISKANADAKKYYKWYKSVSDIGLNASTVTWDDILNALPDLSSLKFAAWKEVYPNLDMPSSSISSRLIITVDGATIGYVGMSIWDIQNNVYYYRTHDGTNYTTWKSI